MNIYFKNLHIVIRCKGFFCLFTLNNCFKGGAYRMLGCLEEGLSTLVLFMAKRVKQVVFSTLSSCIICKMATPRTSLYFQDFMVSIFLQMLHQVPVVL